MWIVLRRLLDGAGDSRMYVMPIMRLLTVSPISMAGDEPLDAELRAFVYSMQTEFSIGFRHRPRPAHCWSSGGSRADGHAQETGIALAPAAHVE
jgi:hypothetical protein